MKCAKARNDDFERHIISQIETATENKKTVLKRISHIKLLTVAPSSTLLPSADLKGLWDSLIYATKMKENLFRYI